MASRFRDEAKCIYHPNYVHVYVSASIHEVMLITVKSAVMIVNHIACIYCFHRFCFVQPEKKMLDWIWSFTVLLYNQWDKCLCLESYKRQPC